MIKEELMCGRLKSDRSYSTGNGILCDFASQGGAHVHMRCAAGNSTPNG